MPEREGWYTRYFAAGSVSSASALAERRSQALTPSQMGIGAAARASTASHCAPVMGITENTPWRGGSRSTDSCMAIPARKARSMAGLDSTPWAKRERSSLRTLKAWNSGTW